VLKKNLCLAALIGYVACASAAPLASKHVLVVEEDSGQVLYQKNADVTAPIASLTKLMTAMVVLDANPDMDQLIPIEAPGLATRMRSRSRLPVGLTMPRRTVLQLALMSSDNRAAQSLAEAYPGGIDAFLAAVAEKEQALGMTHTYIEEPTGLSPNNRSTPADLVKMAQAASQYPDIARITTDSGDVVDVNGRPLEYHNTNRLVGRKGWEDSILLSKTGTTNAAGRCLVMRLQAAGRTITVVLLNAKAGAARFLDAMKIRSFVAGETSMAMLDAPSARPARGAPRYHYVKSHKRVRMTLASRAA
jgi:D-alanyl-D-alanine carboxypeptidase/D-alanyl-D-alanine endopeptidase (penicillin-binding protein 7)